MKRLLILLFLLATGATAADHTRLSVVNDDFDKARAEAIDRKVPLFVEVWAPW